MFEDNQHHADVLLKLPGTEDGFLLNSSALEVWRACDGENSVTDIVAHLETRFARSPRLADDVRSTVKKLETAGLLRLEPCVKVRLADVTFFVINCKEDAERRHFMSRQLDRLGLRHVFIAGVVTEPETVGKTLAHIKALMAAENQAPFAILEDDCQLSVLIPDTLKLPKGVDAVSLGTCETALPPSAGVVQQNRWFSRISRSWIRIYNMGASHGVLYLSEPFRRRALEALLESACEGADGPVDAVLAALQSNATVIAPVEPLCYQAAALGGRESVTHRSLLRSPSATDIHARVNNMEIVDLNGQKFYLFLDVFVHWQSPKVTAVCAYYGDDIDWWQHGIDYEDVRLVFRGGEVPGTFIPYRLDSWEPSMLLDFEDAELAAYIRSDEIIEFEIVAGSHRKRFRVTTSALPERGCTMSLIIRDKNRWLRYYLDYYLYCMGVDHVYVYDNRSKDAAALKDILEPYLLRNQATLIPWHYRWRNRIDGKQIGQPPQQVHSLNRYGRCSWIGFFDIDEYLRIPGRTIPEFLSQYDPVELGGVSFDLRWFMHRGDTALENAGNPLLNFLHCKPDPLGRKRQKLFVSPKNVRFMRFHWIQEDQQELKVTDREVFFHHYYLTASRYNDGLSDTSSVYDDYMEVAFGDTLRALDAAALSRTKNKLPDPPSTTGEWIEHVRRSLEAADRCQSALSDEALEVRGMCGSRNRHFLNNLCRFDGCRYLEIGSWAGASLCSAMCRNSIYAVSIDNWSQFRGPVHEFRKNVSAFMGDSRVTHLERDCFAVDTSRLGPFDVYFYDGSHTEEAHYNAIVRFQKLMSDPAVIVIDDWNSEKVRAGTRRGLKDSGLSVAFEQEIVAGDRDSPEWPFTNDKNGWWCGMLVLVVEGSTTGSTDAL